jgi:hypothetical protein
MKKLLLKLQNKLKNKGLRKTIHTILIYFRKTSNRSIVKYEFSRNLDIRKDILSKYNFSGELLDIFITNKENVVHKWHHYIPLYDKYFSKYRGRQVRFLEIGVSKGGAFKCGENILVKTQ